MTRTQRRRSMIHHLRQRSRTTQRTRPVKRGYTSGRSASRPRALVTHLIRLSGVDPITASMFKDSSCDAASKRLGLKPVAKVRKRKTVTGRHVIVAAPVRNKKTGEIEIGQKSVRRRGNGRSRRRAGTTTITVHHWTVEQVAAILDNTKPRKVEYKQLKADALDTYDAITASTSATLRRLPRNRRWSKRRNRR